MKGLREHPPGSGQWELSFYDKTRKPTRKYIRFRASGETAAILKAADYVKSYQIGNFDPWSSAVDDIEHAAIAYLKAHRHQRPNTIKNKVSLLSRFVGFLTDRSFRNINTDTIARFMATGRKESTQDVQSMALNGFFKWCVDEGYTKKNPVAEWRKRSGISSKRQSDKEGLTIEQAVQMIGACSGMENYFPALLELAFCTGLRKSELISLNIRDVQLNGRGGSIHIREWVHPQTGKHYVPKSTPRVVPLVPRASALLSRLIDALATDDPWQRLFGAASDSRLEVPENSPSNYFRDYRPLIGLGPSYTFHSTRHSFLTWLIMCSVDPYAVQDIAGHADLTTQQRYVHFSRVMLSGGASKARREIVAFLCPGVSPDALSVAFPDSSSWYGSAVSGSRLDILDILFGGLLYDEELLQAFKRADMRRSAGRN